MLSFIFHITNTCLLLMMFSLVWSIVVPKKRVWPLENKKSWQFYWIWILTILAWLGFNILFFTGFTSMNYYPALRLYVGIPLMLIGGSFALWGVYTLGIINSLGLKDEFVERGPYSYTRNPQYSGDIFLIIGMVVLAANIEVLTTGVLAALCFFLGPFSEESWLEEHYGSTYSEYKSNTSRFL